VMARSWGGRQSARQRHPALHFRREIPQ